MSLSTSRHPNQTTSAPGPAAETSADQLEPVAHRIYRALVCRGTDVASVELLADALNVPDPAVRAAAAHASCLGLCAAGPELLVFCLPPEPLTAGFVAEHRDGRLLLRLPRRGRRPSLLLSGRQVGPVPAGERDQTVGAGELAHLVSRLTLMARAWLPSATVSPTRVLFELIAAGWRSGPPPRPRTTDELVVHRVDFSHPIGRGPFGPTHRLELVTHYHEGGHQLVNVYPGLGESQR